MKNLVIGQDKRVADFVSIGVGELTKYDKYTTIGLEKDGKLIAGIVYFEFNSNNVTASIYGIGKTWLNREFLWAIFHYPFEQACVKRMTAVIEEDNRESINFVERLGFSREATLQKAGKYGDLHIYRMFREECKWLEVSNVSRSTRTKENSTTAYA